jgi:hypothetical protein
LRTGKEGTLSLQKRNTQKEGKKRPSKRTLKAPLRSLILKGEVERLGSYAWLMGGFFYCHIAATTSSKAADKESGF